MIKLRHKVPLMTAIGLIFACLLMGCSGMGPTVFVHRTYNFSFIERVAVVPFENMSSDQGAGGKLTHIFMTELLATEAFDVVEPGEVTKATLKFSPTQMTQEQLKEVGKTLKVQGIILGSVNESGTVRSGSGGSPTVTLDVRLVETETGETVWSATHSEGGSSFWSSLFGTGGASQSEVARRCARKVIRTLVK